MTISTILFGWDQPTAFSPAALCIMDTRHLIRNKPNGALNRGLYKGYAHGAAEHGEVKEEARDRTHVSNRHKQNQ